MIRRLAPVLRVTPARYHRPFTIVLLGVVAFTALLAVGVPSRRAFSLPLYARQTGQPCATCHTAFLELTPFGHRFKLGGYTLGGGDWDGPPLRSCCNPLLPIRRALSQVAPRPALV